MDLAFLKDLPVPVAMLIVFGYLLLQLTKSNDKASERYTDSQVKTAQALEKFSGLVEQMLKK